MPIRWPFLGLDGPQRYIGRVQRSEDKETPTFPHKNCVSKRLEVNFLAPATVAELADALDLGSSGATHGGSSPSGRTWWQDLTVAVTVITLFSRV